jgi:hypothetical protein
MLNTNYGVQVEIALGPLGLRIRCNKWAVTVPRQP